LAKTDHVDQVAPGARVTWDVTVSNTGTGPATGVSISDTLPPGTTFVSATNGGTLTGSEVTWAIGDVPAGASKTVQITLIVGSDAGSSLTNVARATTPGGPLVTASDTDKILTPTPSKAPNPGKLAVTGAAGVGALTMTALALVGVGVLFTRRRRTSA
jgi:uncharacterized repeat protein (TIGR01451 family)